MSNKQYMCLLRSDNAEGCEKPSPSDMEVMYAKYQAWQTKFADNIVDMGSKLGSEGAVVRHDSVKDGPFIELKEVIGGYMLISAANKEAAIAVIQASPMVESSSVSIEIREINAL
ncbi:MULTISPECIES: YciI family protein [unclassified Agarivorans]|uniref:YciI family protein n=1 Tax=unclassified Agarivorans TaxID=2636026 RepID=UPI0026E1EA75|nr:MULTISPECIES: YciI family protein [unclassified Agarivorans]MDO6684040.1 YciI family protein [Agarivorans sp. 3_MG-2023]MDO6714226.1 YciI family protein [Agarivorans sp. 2_MG-2023]MDO6762536.1 YciI family protein [Agarivorans sp. 1_MG-2023]